MSCCSIWDCRSYPDIAVTRDAGGGGGIPIVVLTSDDSPLSKEIAFSSGTTGYLLKMELEPARLHHALRQAFRRGRKTGGMPNPAI